MGRSDSQALQKVSKLLFIFIIITLLLKLKPAYNVLPYVTISTFFTFLYNLNKLYHTEKLYIIPITKMKQAVTVVIMRVKMSCLSKALKTVLTTNKP